MQNRKRLRADFQNDPINIIDRTVLAGAVPEAAPTLATDGYPCWFEDPVTRVPTHPDVFYGIIDIDGGVTPTATIAVYGYNTPPAAPALLTNWQLIYTVTVDDPPNFVLIPSAGFDRFALVVTAVTGGPTGVRIRIVSSSSEATSVMVATGVAAGISNQVDLIRVRGVNTGLTITGYQGIAAYDPVGAAVSEVYVDGTTGNLYVGGDVGDNEAESTSHPNKLGAVAAQVLLADATNARVVKLLTDLQRRLRVRDAAFDSLAQNNRVARTNPEATEYNPVLDGDNRWNVAVNRSNTAAGTSDFLIEMGRFNTLLIRLDISGGVTMTVWMPDDNAAAPGVINITPLFYSTAALGPAGVSFINTADLIVCGLACPCVYVRLVRSDNTNSEEVYFFRKFAGGGDC